MFGTGAGERLEAVLSGDKTDRFFRKVGWKIMDNETNQVVQGVENTAPVLTLDPFAGTEKVP